MASRADEAASADALVPGAGEAVREDDLVLRPAAAFEEVEAEDEEEYEDDTMRRARAGAECAVMARGRKE